MTGRAEPNSPLARWSALPAERHSSTLLLTKKSENEKHYADSRAETKLDLPAKRD